MDLLASAVHNNVAWCSLVSRGAGSADTSAGVWMSAGRPPPLFPDAVTLEVGVSATRLVGMLAGRETCSVKDSYADVDLEPHGFTGLFDARWIGRADPPDTPVPMGWSTVTAPAALEAWSAAAGLPAGLPAGLLSEPTVRILAAHRDGRLTAGAAANRSGAVIGISNVFHVDGGAGRVSDEIVTVVHRSFPGMAVVGYEHGADLEAARRNRFADLGPLRVWLRS